MLQFTDVERLCNKEGSKWMDRSPWEGYKIDIVGGVGADGDGNRRDQLGVNEWRKYGETTGIGGGIS